MIDLLKLHAANGNSLQLNLMRQVALSDFLIFPEQHVKVTDFDVTDFHQSHSTRYTSAFSNTSCSGSLGNKKLLILLTLALSCTYLNSLIRMYKS